MSQLQIYQQTIDPILDYYVETGYLSDVYTAKATGTGKHDLGT